MYEPLQEISTLMNGMTDYDDPHAVAHSRRIESALTATAEQIDTLLRDTAEESRRQRLKVIYRGLLASARAVARLGETAVERSGQAR